MKILHLTNCNSDSSLIYDAVLNVNGEYIKHTAEIEFLDECIEFDFVIKDRYPHKVSESFFRENLVLSMIPSFLPSAVGRNTILKSVVFNEPLGGSIFYLKSNKYSILMVETFELKLDFNKESLETAFDKIFDNLLKLVNKNLEIYLTKGKLASLADFYEIAPKIEDEFLNNANILEILPEGYSTKLANINEQIKPIFYSG